MYRQDFIKRQLEAFARALAAMSGLRLEGKPEQALAEARGAYAALGVDDSLLRLDDASLAMLLGSGEKLAALAELLGEESAARLALGEAGPALDLSRRSASLRRVSRG